LFKIDALCACCGAAGASCRPSPGFLVPFFLPRMGSRGLEGLCFKQRVSGAADSAPAGFLEGRKQRAAELQCSAKAGRPRWRSRWRKRT